MNLVTSLAAARAPSGLCQLSVARVDIADRQVRYRIACSCGAAGGTVISAYDEEERFWADPLVFECGTCGSSAVFFDSRRDGYNAVLSDFSAYSSRTRDEPVKCGSCGSRQHQIMASYRYEFDDEEVEEEWSAEERQQMPDVFSSAGFELTCRQCGEAQWLGEFECA